MDGAAMERDITTSIEDETLSICLLDCRSSLSGLRSIHVKEGGGGDHLDIPAARELATTLDAPAIKANVSVDNTAMEGIYTASINTISIEDETLPVCPLDVRSLCQMVQNPPPDIVTQPVGSAAVHFIAVVY